MSQDHFATHLHDPSREGGASDLNQPINDQDMGFQPAPAVESTAQKRSIPFWLVLIGVIVLLFAGSVGYVKLFGSSRSTQAIYRSTNRSSFDQSNGMMAAQTPAPYTSIPPVSNEVLSQNIPASVKPTSTTSLAEPASLTEPPSSASVTTNSSTRHSDAASRHQDVESIALVQQAIDAQNIQIGQLKKEIAALRTQLAPRFSAVPVKASPRPLMQQGFHIKQIVPGQGWVEDEATGRQTIVRVGDTLGEAKVLKIDANHYTITTTAGVIQ